MRVDASCIVRITPTVTVPAMEKLHTCGVRDDEPDFWISCYLCNMHVVLSRALLMYLHRAEKYTCSYCCMMLLLFCLKFKISIAFFINLNYANQ